LTRLALRLAEPDQQIAALAWVGLRAMALELERPAEPAQRLVGGELGQRALPGEARIGHGLGRVDGGGRVGPGMGAVRCARSGLGAHELLERLGDAAVKARAARAA